jgi:hypothetical protein
MESVEPALPIARLGLRKDTLIVGLASRQEMIENPRQFMGGGGDGFGSTEAGAQAAVEVSERGVTVG